MSKPITLPEASRPRAHGRTRTTTRGAYLKRILSVYLFPHLGPLSFWYETPEVNDPAFGQAIDQYYMVFRGKADYRGPFDTNGVPLLDYRGDIGRQYNPIAIAQYGLACFNRYKQASDQIAKERFLRVADWLAESLELNARGCRVWNHHFDWPYRQPLIAPWYSGLAQGQGISVLVRAAIDTGQPKYQDAAIAAFAALRTDITQGGVTTRDEDGALWIEEYLVDPPSHILNGFIWGLWGVHDFARWTGDMRARELFQECVHTIAHNLPRYDTGFWSLYELPHDGPSMLASPYYHRLHIVQLRVLHRLTRLSAFAHFADRWERYARSRWSRNRALVQKAWFKLRHY